MFFKLQTRIYSASKADDIRLVRKLQRILLHSWNAKLLAVRRVTQDNTGKKTAGIDGVKILSSEKRWKLALDLKINGIAQPVRRIWIPKPGTDEKRPLGIPTIYDRALQALVKLALEPEWEARFEPNSYGFRPGRNCHDAIKQIKNAIDKQAKYCLDADISKCFDCINHDALLNRLGLRGYLRQQIKSWLKAGIMNDDAFEETEKGTPQGGVLSPLLANIALHGMEIKLADYIQSVNLYYPNGEKMRTKDKLSSLSFIRYADDFVILHKDLSVIDQCKSIVSEMLHEMGLELKPSKTRIAHTLDVEKCIDGIVGFRFLGFYIRHVRSESKTSYVAGKRLGYRTMIVPSKESCRKHQQEISKIIRKHAIAPQEALILNLNPIIRGWSKYFSPSDAKNEGVFQVQDYLVYKKLCRWEIHRHKKLQNPSPYWQVVGNRQRFITPSKVFLAFHTDSASSINHYVKVIGSRSPYDGDNVYWSMRLGRHPELSTTTVKLLKNQKGRCALCNASFHSTDQMEIDHILPISMGGKRIFKNLQLVHRNCHIKKSNLEKTLKRFDKSTKIE